MIQPDAAALAGRLGAELGLTTRTAHLYHGDDGWAVLVDFCERDGTTPAVVRQCGNNLYTAYQFSDLEHTLKTLRSDADLHALLLRWHREVTPTAAKEETADA